MPCNDISERVLIKLDKDSRLVKYRFSKNTCGGVIGAERIVLDLVKGMKAEDIVSLSETDLLSRADSKDKDDEFVMLKHLFGVKIALEVYLGKSPGNKGEKCVLAGVEYSENETVVDVDINLNLVTSRIESCGDCGLK